MNAMQNPLAEIERILADDPAREVATNIAAKVSDLGDGQARYLSYRQLAKFGNIDPKDQKLAQSIAILTSEKVALLSIFYVYEPEDGDEHKLSAEEFAQAMRLGFFVDPSSGKKDQDFRNRLYPYFERRN